MVVIHCVYCTVVAFVVFVCISGRSWRRMRAPSACLPWNNVALHQQVKAARKGSVVPCFVDRQRQACAANHHPRSRCSPHSFSCKHNSCLTHHFVYIGCRGSLYKRGYRKRPKLGLYGESGVRCGVEGAQTGVRERGPGSASSAASRRQGRVAREPFSGGIQCAQSLHLLEHYNALVCMSSPPH